MQQLNPGQVVWGSNEREQRDKDQQSRRVLIAGVSGFIGRRVSAHLRAFGAQVAGVSRTPHDLQVLGFSWSHEDLSRAVRGADVVINLAGRSLTARRWTPAVREELRESRIGTTRRLVAAMADLDREERPRLLINASGVGYYGMHPDREFTEDDPPGDDFIAELCRDWEAAALEAEEHIERVVMLRTGSVLGNGGGPFKRMLPFFRLGVGGWLGGGGQWLSWIHVDDLTDLIEKIIESDRFGGPVNCVSPNPVTSREFSRVFARLMEKPCWPIPRFALRLAVGDIADILVKGQKALPKKTLQGGFKFNYPEIEGALRSLLE